ncbi:hypothetical protein [robinz microvirus RP_97]|nr:hypothetical protein [robinz microvirus RP_97]
MVAGFLFDFGDFVPVVLFDELGLGGDSCPLWAVCSDEQCASSHGVVGTLEGVPNFVHCCDFGCCHFGDPLLDVGLGLFCHFVAVCYRDFDHGAILS